MDSTWSICLAVPRRLQAAEGISGGQLSILAHKSIDQEQPYLFVSAPFCHHGSGPARSIAAFSRTGENLTVLTLDDFDDEVDYGDERI